MAPQRLAELIGMTYEKVYKYDTGINRIAATRLYAIALALGTDVRFFFERSGAALSILVIGIVLAGWSG